MFSPGRPPHQIGTRSASTRQRRRRAQTEVERESALPADLFECQEPMVEAAVLEAAARVFLDKLGLPPAPDADADDVPPSLESVDQDAIDACLRHFAALPSEPPPELSRGLDDERVWVLVDLARNGTGVGRQRSTHELRQVLRERSADAADHAGLFAELAHKLEGAVRGGGFPVVFEALLLEARVALRRLDVDAAAEKAHA